MTLLTTSFLHTTLASPLVLASGIWGVKPSLLLRAAEAGCGAVTTKSAGPRPRRGHVNPTCLDWGHGLINAIGLPNPGAAQEVAMIREVKAALVGEQVAVIASFFADTAAGFGEVARTLAAAQPNFLEANISCPNVHDDFGEPFAAQAESAAAVVTAVKQAVPDIPLIVKLAPNVPNIGRIAQAVVTAGAEAICAINTMPGMVIDIESGMPILQNRSGGLSGPVLHPIALNCVYNIHKAVPQTPIIGTGGISNGAEAIAMLMAGATLVGVGSAVHYRGPEAFILIRQEMEAWLNEHGYTNCEAIRGMAHHEPSYPTSPSPPPIPHIL